MGRTTLPLHSLLAQHTPQAQPNARAKHNRAPQTAASHSLQPAGAVRIIGGQWKRRKLPIAAISSTACLRPTPDRVRETLFNWLGQNLTGWHCMDVCAGTGALGFEAASRGAASVLLFEKHPTLAAQLHANKTLLQASAIHIQTGDGLAAMQQLAQRQPHSINAIFLDPPFNANWYNQALQAAELLLHPQGFCYLEAPHEWAQDELAAAGWQRLRHLKAGAVHAHLLQPLPEPAP